MDNAPQILVRHVRMTPLAACLALALSLPAVAMADDRNSVASIPRRFAAIGVDRFVESGIPKTPRTPHYALSNSLPKTNSLPNRPATTLTVTNCDDAGMGSLRDTVASAVSGDIVDLSGLTCATITLTTGAITIPLTASNLTLSGPGASALTIDGGLSAGHYNRVLNHRGAGTLIIQGLTIADAKYQGTASLAGGCIYSQSNVTLTSSTVSGCAVVGDAGARGGGIYAIGNVTLLNSTITGNHAQALISGYADGGGIFATRVVSAKYSTINNNQAINTMNPGARGGGLFAGSGGNITITSSTISGNQAKIGAGVFATSSIGAYTLAINNSTISGNVAVANAGGVLSGASLTTLANSTIAFNVGPASGAGLYVASGPLQMQSSIVAANRDASWTASDLHAAAPITGANNLITTTTVMAPMDTITTCPKLGPLANNGGPTPTHALLHNTGTASPAIDNGNNMGGDLFDQRSTSFPRTFGATTDIGAYEWQGEIGDRVFFDSLESVCN